MMMFFNVFLAFFMESISTGTFCQPSFAPLKLEYLHRKETMKFSVENIPLLSFRKFDIFLFLILVRNFNRAKKLKFGKK